ncbi:hypothetical protein [Dehalobacter sp. TeCB1]|jgi:hypothetical protein|uniref:hypothetical protein n=1 Tax=Dehalobacter sp. TeCB1 TaxID=1843715 RepID=UPI00083B32FB|nr:hypothetical protein [Dehalobacter sp. TeCB1]OCZ52195.1 hypothetical protein A7D23_11315 [Dehalobacter sp. TeCB1]
MFYDKKLDIITTGQGYVDDYGIPHKGEETVLKSISCDIQPYSSELMYREYGYQEQVIKRVFCDIDPDIKKGMIAIDANGKRFKIVKIIDWDDYMEVMLDDE